MFLCGRVYLKSEQRAGFFFENGYKGKGSFNRMGGEGGPKRKTATPPLPPIAEQGKGAGSPVAARFGRAGLGRRPGTRGKGKGGALEGIPASPWAGMVRRGGAT